MNEPYRRATYDEIAIGDEASFGVRVDEAMVRSFAEFSGDRNPLHMDEHYARHTAPGRRIAHGMIVGALFSRLVGMHLPGKYSLYLSQTLRFRNPIAFDADIIIKGKVIHKSDAHRTVTIHTKAEDPDTGTVLVDGEAIVGILK